MIVKVWAFCPKYHFLSREIIGIRALQALQQGDMAMPDIKQSQLMQRAAKLIKYLRDYSSMYIARRFFQLVVSPQQPLSARNGQPRKGWQSKPLEYAQHGSNVDVQEQINQERKGYPLLILGTLVDIDSAG